MFLHVQRDAPTSGCFTPNPTRFQDGATQPLFIILIIMQRLILTVQTLQIFQLNILKILLQNSAS